MLSVSSRDRISYPQRSLDSSLPLALFLSGGELEYQLGTWGSLLAACELSRRSFWLRGDERAEGVTLDYSF